MGSTNRRDKIEITAFSLDLFAFDKYKFIACKQMYVCKIEGKILQFLQFEIYDSFGLTQNG